MDIYHFDAEQAFVQSELEEEIYMKLPPTCGSESGTVVRLNRSLYGLKQASRAWNTLLGRARRMHDFERCLTDPCVFRRMNGERVQMMLAVHVDDMIVVGSKHDCSELRSSLGPSFPIKDLGELEWNLRCEFERDRIVGRLKISQSEFVDKLSERFKVVTTRPTPACSTIELRTLNTDDEEVNAPYREAVGSLMWLANMTRPDIASSVRAVARFTNRPGVEHWKAVVRILQYLIGTKDLGITYHRGSREGFVAYADSAYSSKADDRRSVSGGVVMYAGAAVTWFSRTQRCVTLSTTESEYVVLGDCIKETLFVRGVLELLVPYTTFRPVRVYEDNQGAIHLADNPMSSARTKHIDIRHHFVRSLISEGEIEVIHVASEEQHADVMTKALGEEEFIYHRATLMNIRGITV